MVLSPLEAQEFFAAWLGLLAFVNEEQGIDPAFGRPDSPVGLPTEQMMPIRDRLWEDVSAIDRYVDAVWDMPAGQISLLKSWKRGVTGTFVAFRHLKKHSIFLGEQAVYGVVGITNPIGEILPPEPMLVHTALIPFRDRIIYDSLLGTYNIHIGPTMRKGFNEEYRAAKAAGKILTALP